MRELLDLTGRVVIVTGGSRGVGLGITERFLEAGAEVVICGRKQPEATIVAGGREAVFTPADVREVEQIESVVAFACERFGRLDVLVNNAGGAPQADAATVSPRFSESIIKLNSDCPVELRAAGERRDAATGRGRIDHQYRQRERSPTLARYGGVRSCKGRRPESDAIPGDRMGASSSHQRHHRGHDQDGAGASPLRRRRRDRLGGVGPFHSAASASREMSAISASFSPVR